MEEDGIWRTVGGRRVFIKTGQSLEEAMIKSGKFSNLVRAERRKKKGNFRNIILPPQEKAIFDSAINTYYYSENKDDYIGCKEVGNYFYMFTIQGFGEYTVFKRMKIAGNEEDIKAFRRRIGK